MSSPLRPLRHGLLFILAAILAAFSLIACGPADPPQAPVVIVAPATSAEPLPPINKALEAELVSHANRAKKPGDAIVHIVSSVGSPPLTRDLAPMRGKDVEHGTARDRKIRDNIAALQADLSNLAAKAPGLDLLGPMDIASQYPQARIYALSSGLSTFAPVDLFALTAGGWNFDPTQVAESVHRQGRLNLTAHHVTFAGLGVTGGSTQPRLPAFARKQVQDLWLQICNSAGAAKCDLAEGEPPSTPPKATMRVPVIDVPAAFTDRDGCPLYTRLDDETTHFAADSADLPAAANAVLSPLIESAKRCRVREVDVVGHIACATLECHDSSNLSGRRAEAVAARLLALGLPPSLLGTVTGRGGSDPVIPNLTLDGWFIESAAALNRRVEVSLVR
ncbi:OmpA family protein [Nocardia brasiliensis]|uniref:OmpA family protein n=1 Tax=Nocardia brasiliensis TaxID=37326 RepID=UPI003D8DA5BD